MLVVRMLSPSVETNILDIDKNKKKSRSGSVNQIVDIFSCRKVTFFKNLMQYFGRKIIN